MNSNDALVGQIKEIYSRLVYTHKTHEKCSEILYSRHRAFRIAQIVLSALTTGGIVTAVAGSVAWVGIIAAVVSGIQLFLNTYLKDSNLSAQADKFGHIANLLVPIRESYLSLLVDIKELGLTKPEIAKRRDALMNEQSLVLVSAPKTFPAGYRSAHRALNLNQEFTFSPGEVEMFLPENLRG